jgi:hypothetical protein
MIMGCNEIEARADWICLEVVWLKTSWLGHLVLFLKINLCYLPLIFSVLEVHMQPTLKACQFTFSLEYGLC